MMTSNEARAAQGGGAAVPHQAAPADSVTQGWALVERVQAGDSEAFGELYARYADMVYRYARSRVRQHELAEDLTAEVFVRALRRIGALTWQGRDVGAWLVTIARHLVADHARASHRRPEVLGLEPRDADTPVASSMPPAPDAAVEALLRDRELLAAMRTLRDRNHVQYACLVLRFWHGMSVAETAAAIGVSRTAIRALQYRAVRTLAQLLPADFWEAHR